MSPTTTRTDPSAPPVHAGVRAEVLCTPEQLDAARALLHRVYCEEQGWSPRPDNPSEQRIARLSSGQLGLIDRYDHCCTWIGLVTRARVLGCLRLIDRQTAGALELERYTKLPASLARARAQLVEVNRLAVAPELRGRDAAHLLMLALLTTASTMDTGLITAATSRTANYARRVVGMIDAGLQFSYAPNDPEPARVLALLDRDRITDRIECLRRWLTRSRSTLTPNLGEVDVRVSQL